MNQVANFAKNKDQDGYNKWYSSQNDYIKALVKINSLLNNEKKGQMIDWGMQLKILSSRMRMDKGEVDQILGEAKMHQNVISTIKVKMGSLKSMGLDGGEIGRIYNQSINILSEQNDKSNTGAALNMILMQVSNSEGKNLLNQTFRTILERYY